MSEPTRWIKDERAPREVVELLETMSPPHPAPASLASRLANRFAEAGTTMGGTPLAGAFWPKLAWVAAALLVSGGAVLAAARGSVVQKAAPPPSANTVSEAPPRLPIGDPARSVEVPDPASPSTDRPAVESGVALGRPQRVASQSSPRRPLAADTLAEEEIILEDARRALTTEPQRALRLLKLHQRRFPNGELTAERMFLRVNALKQLDRAAEARREADTLVKRFPSSAYARLVPALVDSAVPGAKP